MARVNHKLVRQRLNEKRSKITDRQFFTSRMFAGHFEDMAAAQTRRYHYNRRVHVNIFWKTKEPFTAMTDNQVIRINAGNPMVTKVRGRENRYHVLCGLFAHELGHVLYTDFLASQTYANYLASYRWYPQPPVLKTSVDASNEKDLWDYVKDSPENLEMVQQLAHHISNVLEDGYVENRMLNNFPGTLGFGLETYREIKYKKINTVTEFIEQEENEDRHIFESILGIMLSYVLFGEIKYGEEPLSDERIQVVFGLLDEIDTALMTDSGKERYQAVNMVLVRCWDYIKDFCEVCKERQKEAAAAGGTSTAAQTLSQILQSIAGSSEMGEGSGTPVAEAPGSSGGSVTAAARARTRAAAAAPKEESEEEENPSQTGSGEEGEPDEEENTPQTGSEEESESGTEENASQTGPEEEENPSGSGDSMLGSNAELEGEAAAGSPLIGSGKQEVSQGEKGRIPYQQTEHVSSPVGGTTTRNNEYRREQYEHAAADIERILDQMAEKAACEELENERIRELNDAAQNISYGNIHEGVHIQVNRIASVDEALVDQYHAISGPLEMISRQLQRSLVKQLQENRRGGKQTGLVMGRRLDTHALCRNDGKIFYSNKLPNEIPELAVGLLLDESGSMSSCDRCTYARAAAIILYDFCESLGIPVMVYGHSTGYHNGCDSVELYSYAEFDGFDQDDKYRLMDISARSCNRDGAALRYMAENLAKRPEAVRLLILVSDGQPADTGYHGSAAEEDLRGIKQEYQRKGIIFVAAAIGNDKENIERIYGDSFLDISDLNQLPTKLTNVVKRHIRV